MSQMQEISWYAVQDTRNCFRLFRKYVLFYDICVYAVFSGKCCKIRIDHQLQLYWWVAFTNYLLQTTSIPSIKLRFSAGQIYDPTLPNVHSSDEKIEFLNKTLYLPSGINKPHVRRIVNLLKDTEKRSLLLGSDLQNCPKAGVICSQAKEKAKVYHWPKLTFHNKWITA